MKRSIAIIGSLLTVTVLLSGSSLAYQWHYVDSVFRAEDCTNEGDAVGAPNGDHATIGQSGEVAKLGIIILNMSIDNAIPPDTTFTVFASSAIEETYNLSIIDEDWVYRIDYPSPKGDTTNQDFYVPGSPTVHWCYIEIRGLTGDDSDPSDPIYGPEIDAVGWYG